jgi:hypothetical protein
VMHFCSRLRISSSIHGCCCFPLNSERFVSICLDTFLGYARLCSCKLSWSSQVKENSIRNLLPKFFGNLQTFFETTILIRAGSQEKAAESNFSVELPRR